MQRLTLVHESGQDGEYFRFSNGGDKKAAEGGEKDGKGDTKGDGKGKGNNKSGSNEKGEKGEKVEKGKNIDKHVGENGADKDDFKIDKNHQDQKEDEDRPDKSTDGGENKRKAKREDKSDHCAEGDTQHSADDAGSEDNGETSSGTRVE